MNFYDCVVCPKSMLANTLVISSNISQVMVEMRRKLTFVLMLKLPATANPCVKLSTMLAIRFNHPLVCNHSPKSHQYGTLISMTKSQYNPSKSSQTLSLQPSSSSLNFLYRYLKDNKQRYCTQLLKISS